MILLYLAKVCPRGHPDTLYSSKTLPAPNQDRQEDISGPKLLDTTSRKILPGPKTIQDKSGPEASQALRQVKTSPALRQVQP